MHRQTATGGTAKGNLEIEFIGPRPFNRLCSNLILLSYALIIRPRLLVCPQKKDRDDDYALHDPEEEDSV